MSEKIHIGDPPEEKADTSKSAMVNSAAYLLVSRGMSRKGKDRSGFVDWLHPFGVAEKVRMYGEEAYTVALLHDVVEDYEVTLEALRDLGFPEIIVLAVDAMSRREDETYFQCIERIKKNRLATIVKIADISHNLSRGNSAASLYFRWQTALTRLKSSWI